MFKLLNKYKYLKVFFIYFIVVSIIFLLINNINKQDNFIDTAVSSTTTSTTSSTTTSTTSSTTSSTTTTTTSSTTTTTTSSTTTTTLLSVNVENIEDAQRELKKLYIYQGKADGVTDKYTILAIKEFQRRSGLVEDGILGPITKQALEKGLNSYINYHNQHDVGINAYEITDEIKYIQNKLTTVGIYTGEIDGIFGYQTMISLKEFQRKAGLIVDGIYGNKTKEALEKGRDSFLALEIQNEIDTSSETTNIEVTTNLTLDLKNYNPNLSCLTGYVNNDDIWVPDPCFYPVLLYRYGNVVQVNSQSELDAYLKENWSSTKEDEYIALGVVPTQNYTDGYNSPVNGLPMSSDSNNSIIIGIKNDNNVMARPQSGPQVADAVVEVLVEGGMTRFINIFYQSDTNYHGPIRSARPTDATILRPVGGVLIASGATGGLIPEIISMGVPVITDTRPEYFRISSRNAPHNLYADTNKLKQLALSKGYKKYTNPQPLFPWGEPSLDTWINNSYLKLTFSTYTSTTWTWNGSEYGRTYYDAYKNYSENNIHYWIDQNGNQEQITVTTVIALFCEPYIHPLQLPSVKTIGEGRAIILHKGKLLDARWKRGSNLDPFHIIDQNDNILYVPKGKVWISLVPNTKSPSFG